MKRRDQPLDGSHTISPSDRLCTIAYHQQGYFSAIQAGLVGYGTSAPASHVKAGEWIEEGQEIYRLHTFPEIYHAELMIDWLWSSNRAGMPQGVFSHRTALDLHELCDVMPRKTHMTVPWHFSRLVTTGPLVLHYGNLMPSDTTYQDGIPLTTVYRTLVDMIWEKTVSPEQLVMAIDNALEQNLLSEKMLAELREEFHHDYSFVDFLYENLEYDCHHLFR